MRLRFQTELEFVQCLANPNYLNCKNIIYTLSYDVAMRGNRFSGFPTRSDTNHAVQSQKHDRSLKFWM